jgi:hypothetical protein
VLLLTFGNRAFAAFWAKGISAGQVAAVRERLLADCETIHRRAQERKDSNHRASQRIREGILCARAVIEGIPASGEDVPGYAKSILDGLERERERLNKDPDDEDGWSLGGLRTVANQVEGLAGL